MLLFFSSILLIIMLLVVLLFMIIILSDLCFKIENLYVCYNNNISKEYKYKIRIQLKFLGVLPFISFTLTDSNSKVSKIMEKMQNGKFKVKGKHAEIFRVIGILYDSIEIKKLKFLLTIDIENPMITSYIVGIISMIIPNIIRRNIKSFDSKKISYKICPLYQHKNIIDLHLESIINIKIVHIINMLKVIGGMNNERTSNRKLNVNCYGKY